MDGIIGGGDGNNNGECLDFLLISISKKSKLFGILIPKI
jgi:hypothetical protein